MNLISSKKSQKKLKFKESILKKTSCEGQIGPFLNKRVLLLKKISIPEIRLADINWLKLYGPGSDNNAPLKRSLISVPTERSVSKLSTDRPKVTDKVVKNGSEVRLKERIIIHKSTRTSDNNSTSPDFRTLTQNPKSLNINNRSHSVFKKNHQKSSPIIPIKSIIPSSSYKIISFDFSTIPRNQKNSISVNDLIKYFHDTSKMRFR